MKVYIEHADGHNAPRMLTFDSEDAALDSLTHYTPEDRDFAREELFSEDGGGEWHDGTDQYTLITFSEAENRSQYWQRVADAIRSDQKAPL
jgi:hypothetical protein